MVDTANAALHQFQKARKKKVKPGKDTAADDQKEKELSTAKDTAVKNLETRITEFSNFLVKAKLNVTNAAAEQEEERKEKLVATKGEGALKEEEKKKKKAAQELEKKKKKKDYAPPPEPAAAEKKAAEEKQAKDVRDKTSEFLITAYRVYLSTFKSDQTRVEAAAIGTTATIAAHGFIDLAPELIAALTGSDGGGLHWLGATKGTKDFMHFELEHDDRPKKVVTATEKSEDKPEPPTPKPEDKKLPSGKGAIEE